MLKETSSKEGKMTRNIQLPLYKEKTYTPEGLASLQRCLIGQPCWASKEAESLGDIVGYCREVTVIADGWLQATITLLDNAHARELMAGLEAVPLRLCFTGIAAIEVAEDKRSYKVEKVKEITKVWLAPQEGYRK